MRKSFIRKGTTIVEVLLYLGLISIFLVIMVDVFVTGANFKLESESTSAVQRDSQFILAKMMNEVSNSASLNVSGNSLILSTGTYSLSGGNLVFTQAGTSTNLNSLETSITNISFTQLGNVDGVPTARVSFDIESNIVKQGNIKETRSFTTTLGLR